MADKTIMLSHLNLL